MLCFLISAFELQVVDSGLNMAWATVYGARNPCYLTCDGADSALHDAMQARCLCPVWPAALYLQTLAPAKLNMEGEAVDMLNEAAKLEETIGRLQLNRPFF